MMRSSWFSAPLDILVATAGTIVQQLRALDEEHREALAAARVDVDREIPRLDDLRARGEAAHHDALHARDRVHWERYRVSTAREAAATTAADLARLLDDLEHVPAAAVPYVRELRRALTTRRDRAPALIAALAASTPRLDLLLTVLRTPELEAERVHLTAAHDTLVDATIALEREEAALHLGYRHREPIRKAIISHLRRLRRWWEPAAEKHPTLPPPDWSDLTAYHGGISGHRSTDPAEGGLPG